MPATARRLLPVILGLLLFGFALHVLRAELHAVSWHDLTIDIRELPPSRFLLAVGLTWINYAVLTGYDFLAFAYIDRRPPRVNVALASFLSYAISNNVGFALLSGASVRYRFYTRWGLSGEELSRIVFSYSVTFWLGLLALGLVMVYSASIALPDNPKFARYTPTYFLSRHVMFLGIAVLAALVAVQVPLTEAFDGVFELP